MRACKPSFFIKLTFNLGALCCGSATAMAAPCVAGSLQNYTTLAGGCNIDVVQFTNFTVLPPSFSAINPNSVILTPTVDPGFIIGLSTTAAAGQTSQASFSFLASSPGFLPGDIKLFAGTVDDPFWIDLGGSFDTLNTHLSPPILSAAQDAALVNLSSDTVSGYAVNAIAIEVPITLLTRTGAIEAATSTAATVGVWATTSRPRVTTRRAPLAQVSAGTWSQVQRMGNPLINELIIGTGFKDRFSMDLPKNDSQFASFFLDPALARVINALTGGGVPIPAAPRTDLLPLVTYAPPIAAAGTPAGPIADLLRLNTGVAPTPPGSINRLGLLGGDAAGFPNGRRYADDVVDIALRAVAGVLNPGFNTAPNNQLGDGVNVNDAPYRTAFPYFADAPSGRDRRHLDPGEPGCTAGAGGPCLP